MNLQLTAALLSLPELRLMTLDIGKGTLAPQLAALEHLEKIGIKHYCLRGTLPDNLLSSLYNLFWLEVVPKERAVGASDPAGGLCGLSGSLHNHTRPGNFPPLFYLFLQNNQITGQLPTQLLSLATHIDLSNNKISGSIPGVNMSSKLVAEDLNLYSNQLEVSREQCAHAVAAGCDFFACDIQSTWPPSMMRSTQ